MEPNFISSLTIKTMGDIYRPNFVVIDDDLVNNIICSTVISKVSPESEVTTFDNPELGLNFIIDKYSNNKKCGPTILFLDINMPTLTGWEVLDRFDKLDAHIKEQVKIYMLSSSVDPQDVERAKENINVTDFIVKPLTMNRVLSVFISHISARKQSEVALLKINAELEEKVKQKTKSLSEALAREKELSRLKSRFVAIASHEFRTPLSMIMSSAELILRQLDKSQQRKRRHVNTIISSVNMMTSTLDDFLSADRIEYGKLRVQITEFDVKKLVADFISNVRTTIKNGQKIVYRHQGNLTLQSDPSLLKHVIANLVSNAIKFSHQKGIVEINTRNDNGTFTLSVKDNGIGISREDKEHLFESFFRGQNAEYIMGTGLGLHIVSKCVNMLQGKIECKSELNKGTEFLFTINSKW